VHHFDHLPMSELRSPLSYSLLELFEAIKAKLTAQAEYVCWRDSVMRRGRPPKENGRSSTTILPDADPGKYVVERWRKRTIDRGKVESAFRIRLLVLSLPRRNCRRLHGTQIGS
jgi:hypothetical protein